MLRFKKGELYLYNDFVYLIFFNINRDCDKKLQYHFFNINFNSKIYLSEENPYIFKMKKLVG